MSATRLNKTYNRFSRTIFSDFVSFSLLQEQILILELNSKNSKYQLWIHWTRNISMKWAVGWKKFSFIFIKHLGCMRRSNSYNVSEMHNTLFDILCLAMSNNYRLGWLQNFIVGKPSISSVFTSWQCHSILGELSVITRFRGVRISGATTA